MRRALFAIGMILTATGAHAAPSQPTGVTVTRADDGHTFTLAWTAVSGAVSYGYSAGYNDSGRAGASGIVPMGPVTFALTGGPGEGWACVWANDASGNGPNQCLSLTVTSSTAVSPNITVQVAGQTALDYRTAKFTWVWDQGLGSSASGFHLACVPVPAGAGLVTTLPPSALEAPVRDVLPATAGAYGCSITAYNAAGDSLPSNVVSLGVLTIVVPNPPTGLQLHP